MLRDYFNNENAKYENDEKCISCGKNGAQYEHIDGGFVCKDCLGKYFCCSDCGKLFDRDDFIRGDQCSGFCKDCTCNH